MPFCVPFDDTTGVAPGNVEDAEDWAVAVRGQNAIGDREHFESIVFSPHVDVPIPISRRAPQSWSLPMRP